jgi:competence protein ComEC
LYLSHPVLRFVKTLLTALLAAALVLATTACEAIPVPPSGTLRVYFLDVGQGDSEIVVADGAAMLIDAGTNASTTVLLRDIRRLGITRFDVVIGTHPHEDHIGGMDRVINQFAIGTIYMPKVSTTTKTFADVLTAIASKGMTVTTPVVGSSFTLGSANCTILAPSAVSGDDLNDASIVIKVTYGNTSFLFAADAETQSESGMLLGATSLKADVLKVAHHGSSSSTTSEFLKAVSPSYAVIEVGAGNDYGYPHQVTLRKLASAGVKVYRTDLNGNVTATSDGLSLSFETER